MRYALVFLISFLPALLAMEGVFGAADALRQVPAISADDVCDPGSQRPECSHLAATPACQMPDDAGAGLLAKTALVAVEVGCSVQP